MVLPSQMGGLKASGRGTLRRRKRGKGGWLVLLVLLIVAGIAVWQFWPGDDTEDAIDTGAEAGVESADTAGGDDGVVPQTPVLTFDGDPESTEGVFADDGSDETNGDTTGPPPSDDASADTTVDNGTDDQDDATIIDAPDRTGDAPDFSLASRRIQQGLDLLAQGKLVDGRAALSAVLTSGEVAVSPREAAMVRERLGKVNERLIFSPVVVPGDPITDTHNVQSGEFLSTIARKYKVGWEILSHINSVAPERLRAGQDIKVLNGPFHCVVYKSAFRLDLYWKDPSGRPIYIRSFTVGLGAENSTPVGMWKVTLKERNPTWYDPRAGRVLDRDDPENPLGERWIAMTGMDENTRAQQGYGIHGTIEPDTIGKQASLGCIRMHNEDVELLFDLLYVGESRVEVRP